MEQEKQKQNKGIWAQLQEAPVNKVEYTNGKWLLEDIMKEYYNQPPKKEVSIIVSEKEYKLATENPEEFQRQWMNMIQEIAKGIL